MFRDSVASPAISHPPLLPYSRMKAPQPMLLFTALSQPSLLVFGTSLAQVSLHTDVARLSFLVGFECRVASFYISRCCNHDALPHRPPQGPEADDLDCTVCKAI